MQQKNIDMQRTGVLQLNVQRVANYGKSEIITRGVFAEKPIPEEMFSMINNWESWKKTGPEHLNV